jgi:hypothetical protein
MSKADDPKNEVLRVNIDIRRELFKLFYLDGTFNIYEKADAQETFQTVLTLIHAMNLKSSERTRILKPKITFEESIKGFPCKIDCTAHANSSLILTLQQECSSCKTLVSRVDFD